ncbi:hypothetical protein [Haloferula sp. A504]|uniref:hypothetical protein n=1 Tax=Haloferula sp. A504 TaxID=3373601 RepID=UPI0031BBE0AE|nr:hypothetical protein [Verrucomicrobiaceae bacterium E54]
MRRVDSLSKWHYRFASLGVHSRLTFQSEVAPRKEVKSNITDPKFGNIRHARGMDDFY